MATENLPFALLGMPVDNLSLSETVEKIEQLIEIYHKDLSPRYVATLNVDFVANVHNCFSSSSRQPELLNILQHASISTLDGMPLLWLARLLGTKVKERVTGVDLIPALAEALSKKKQSFFLLGGDERTLKLFMLYLENDYPGLRIVGTSHPFIPIEGEDLETSEERDKLLVEQINKAAPDVILLNLGNPKQEIWFERVRPYLHVPIAIGVGGSFNILTGRIPRAPNWMQHSGLEWFYRLLHEPKRLFKRYLVDLIKFPLMTLPLIVYHSICRLTYWLFYWTKGLKLRTPLLFISAHQTIAVVPLPKRLGELACREIWQEADELIGQDHVVLDFKDVRQIDLEGIALLIRLWQKAEHEKKQIFALNITADMRLLLKLHRIWDLIKNQVVESPKAILDRLVLKDNSAGLYHAIQQEGNLVIISFFGRLDNNQTFDAYLNQIGPSIQQKKCIVDLSYCTYIDNTGLGFLLQLNRYAEEHYMRLSLVGLAPPLKRQLRQAKIDRLFTIKPRLELP